MYFNPYMWATNPLVSGTVASQRKPIENEKTSTVFAVIGVKINQIAAIDLPA